MVGDSQEEEEEEGLEYEMEGGPSDPSYTTPPSTGGHSSPTHILSQSPTPKASDQRTMPTSRQS